MVQNQNLVEEAKTYNWKGEQRGWDSKLVRVLCDQVIETNSGKFNKN